MTEIPTLGTRYEFARQDGVWVLTCWTCETNVRSWHHVCPGEETIADAALSHEEENHE